MNTRICPPWVTYQKKVKEFFAYDPDVMVGELAETDIEGVYKLPISAKTTRKAYALQRILVPEINFGNVKVLVKVDCEEIGNVLHEAFDGNLLVREITPQEIPGGIADYIQLEPEVIQFENDDISSYTGKTTLLAESIAREIFNVFPFHGYLCTVDIRANKDGDQA